MGTYLSKPITEKVSENGKGNCLSYGSSAMQGWRTYQEDAHNTILDLDKKCFFAVYDGHGGPEVATYTAEHFPNSLKTSQGFLKADFSNALKETFLNFDETLITPEVQFVLKELACMKDNETDDDDDEQEEVNHLCREASMPLAEVMEQYAKSKTECPSIHTNDDAISLNYNVNEAGSSGSGMHEVIDSPVDSSGNAEFTNGKNDSSHSSDESKFVLENGSAEKCDDDTDKECDSKDSQVVNGDIQLDNTNGVASLISSDSKSDIKFDDDEGVDVNSKAISDITNNSGSETSNVSSPKGNSQFKGKGKGLTKKANLIINDESSIKVSDKRLLQKRKAAEKAELIYKQIQTKLINEEEEDEDDLDEEIEEDVEEEQDDDDDDKDESDEELEEEDEVEEIDEESSESENDVDDDESTYNEFSMHMREEPGYDSGCTACVVLIHDSFLTVANVGDSRCVVCRDGKAVDMSIDHKPEDIIETERIIKAGGKITRDKRVNGGLNLSRAIGDHSYKQNKSLKPEEQMISPMPDVKTLEITSEDSFMIVACDGIWNSLSSQEACDFVSSRLQPDTKLSTICEEMFDHCIAPNVFGDGTGCDNMTCIIVRFDHTQFENQKRELDLVAIEAPVDTPQEKRRKLD